MSNPFESLQNLDHAIDDLNQILKGTSSDEVNVGGVVKPSITKAIADHFASIYALASGYLAYQTKSAMDSAGAPSPVTMAFVWSDGSNNGLYGWNGSAWEKSDYDPLSFSYLSENSYTARNAGFESIPLSKYHSKAGVDLTTNLLDPRTVTFTKEVNTASGVWYGAWIEIEYENLSDLDAEFVLDVEHVAGGNFDTFNIVATKANWSPGNHPITLGSSLNGQAVNLYDRVMESSQDNIDHYTAADRLYLVVGDYTASQSANQAATATWKVSARFNRDGRVVASHLTSALSTLLSSNSQAQVDAAVETLNSTISMIGEPKNLPNGRVIGSVNATFSTVDTVYRDSSDQIYSMDATIDTTGANSYSYVSFKVNDDYNDFINRRYRLFIDCDQDRDLIVRVGNGNAWGSGDNSVGAFLYLTFSPSPEDLNNGYVDIDIPSSSAVDFYANPDRVNNQDLFFIVGVDGGADVDDLHLSLSWVDLDSFNTLIYQMVNTSHPHVVVSDKLTRSIPSILSRLTAAEGEIDTIQGSPANSALNAGIEYLPNANVYGQSGRDITFEGQVGQGGVTATKNAHSATYTWYAVKIKVDYDTIEDLNRNLYLGYEHVSGQVPNTFNFVDGPQDDWNPIHHPVGLGTLSSDPINLYDKLMATSQSNRDAYEAQNSLYINIAVYSSDSSVPPAMTSVWKLNPHFELLNSIVVATDLSQALAEQITSEWDAAIQEALSNGQYITCWGDSLTAGGGWTSRLATLSGYPVYNGGTGGENARTILARQGGDIMMINGITIPADTSQVLIADRDVDGGIPTQFGHTVTPLLQGGGHVNPCLIGEVEGTLTWTGSGHSDMTGNWVFARSEAGSEVVIDRPTAIRTKYDRLYNEGITISFIGQNGGYTDLDDLVWQNRRLIEHGNPDKFIVLGLSSGSAALRADYEAAMRKEFGRHFISLREYLSAPIYDTDGTTIINCYGLDDAGLTATQADLDAIATGTVPPQCLSDSVHYTSATKTVIGDMLYRKMVELNLFN